ncbi:histidine kinase [Flavobacterium sp. SUN046]|uniref:sensor histidine kinase n=1 Tax=Flavobacterium sp. SUN046 TaxID=3002440 RepID=UPI002DB8DE7D|nr:histidine kinase [Flavobacterium sp. SUN046]MEC4049126.1 histidine kinase [Flavobacterium sp. SUN046]
MKRNEAELLLKTSLESEKKERERIAADLHDSVSSDLSAIRNFLVVILKIETDDKRKSIFQELKTGVDVAIENTRLVSYKLMPPLLDKLGFVTAIEDYLNNLTKKTQKTFSVQCKDEAFKVDPIVGYELFRVIQEFTTNMLKYGNINQFTLVLYVIEKIYYLELIDDGVKYDLSDLRDASTGTGLRNINSRLKVVGATLTQREVSVGNHFVIQLPHLK